MRGNLSQLTKKLLAGGLGSIAQTAQQQARAFNMVPMVLERSHGGERAFDLYSRLLKDAKVMDAKLTVSEARLPSLQPRRNSGRSLGLCGGRWRPR